MLTAAPWHDSIGDIATAGVTVDHLSRAGIPARHVSGPLEDVDLLVVGGGALLGPTEPASRPLWSRFQTPGAHVLNACGIADGFEDLDFLADYRLVTVRDHEAAALVAPVRPDVEPVPCPATLVEPYEWDFARMLPGYEHLGRLRPGEYVVVHRHPMLAPVSRTIDLPVLVVDAQAFQRYRWRGAGDVLPSTPSTRVVQTYVANAAAVITSSLHLAVMALGAGVPFIAIAPENRRTAKVRRYLRRAGVEDTVIELPTVGRDRRRLASISGSVARRLPYPDVVELALAQSGPIAEASGRERSRAHEHLERVVDVCR